MTGRDKMRRTHRLGCMRWEAWDIPDSCTCDRPWVTECPECEGWGTDAKAEGGNDCPVCDGNGEVYVDDPDE